MKALARTNFTGEQLKIFNNSWEFSVLTAAILDHWIFQEKSK
jgi:hypothetical protein